MFKVFYFFAYFIVTVDAETNKSSSSCISKNMKHRAKKIQWTHMCFSLSSDGRNGRFQLDKMVDVFLCHI